METLRELAIAIYYSIDRQSMQSAESGISKLKALASRLLGTIGIGFSIAGISNLAQTAADVEALKSQFEQVFSEVEEDATARLNAISENTGVSVMRMKGSFTQMAAFAKTTGMDAAESLEIADRAMQAVTDSAAFYDRSIEEVTESMRSFLKGNFEVDASLGLACTEVTRDAAANEMFGESYQKLSEAQKQLTLLKMVEDANAASGALGQAARESDTWTNQLGNLKQSIKDIKAAIGKVFLDPAVKVLKLLDALAQRAAKAFQGLTDEGGAVTKAMDRINAIVKKLQPAFERMGKGAASVMSRAGEAVGALVDRLGGADNVVLIVATAFAALMAVMAAGRIAAFMKAVGGLAGILSRLAGMFSLARLQALLLVAGVMLIFLAVEDFINFMVGNDSVIGTMFDNAGIGAQNARDKIVGAFKAAKEFLLGVWGKIKEAGGVAAGAIAGMWERNSGRVTGTLRRVWGLAKDFLQGVWTFLSQIAGALFGGSAEEIEGSQEEASGGAMATWQNAVGAIVGIFETLLLAVNRIANSVASVVEVAFAAIQWFWSNWGSDCLALLGSVWDSIGGIVNGFIDIVSGVAGFLSSVFTGDWAGAWEAVKQVFLGVWGVISNAASAIWSGITTVFKIALDAISMVFTSVWGGIKTFFFGVLGSIRDFAVSTFSTMKEWIAQKVSEIKESIVGRLQEAVDWISSLPEKAVQWGLDFINGLKQGIESGIEGVVEAVKGVATKVSGFLHFSSPDVGPLAGYESWMPDFMGGLASGIESSEGLVLDKVRGLASSMSLLAQTAVAGASTAAAGAAGASRTSNVTQNVNIANTYSGGTAEAQKAVSRTMNRSASDATAQMARALAYARG